MTVVDIRVDKRVLWVEAGACAHAAPRAVCNLTSPRQPSDDVAYGTLLHFHKHYFQFY